MKTYQEQYSTFASKFRNVNLSYGDQEDKEAFHRGGRALLKSLANELKIADFDLRSNKAGIACSGEITLHSDKIYVQLSDGFMGKSFLVRTVKGKKDYTGGHNNFVKLESDPSVLSKLAGNLLGNN